MTDNEALNEIVSYLTRENEYLQAQAIWLGATAKCLAWLLGYWLWREFVEALTRPRLFG